MTITGDDVLPLESGNKPAVGDWLTSCGDVVGFGCCATTCFCSAVLNIGTFCWVGIGNGSRCPCRLLVKAGFTAESVITSVGLSPIKGGRCV